MLQGKKYQGLLSDIWSSGVILFAMLCGYLPFEDPDTEELYRKIIDGKFEIPDFLSEDAKDILKNILKTDPKKRFNITKIKGHKWFNMLKSRENEGFINRMDENILKKLKILGLNDKECKRQLIKNEHNYITASYYLLLQKKLIQEEHMKTFIDYLNKPNKIQSSLSCPKKLLYEPSIFDVYFYHSINEKIFISEKNLFYEEGIYLFIFYK